MKIVFLAALEMGHAMVKFLSDRNKKHEFYVFTLTEDYKNRSGYLDFSDLSGSVKLFKIDPKRDNELLEKRISEIKPDAIFVIGWSFMIPQLILKMSRIKAIGHHPTLLPRHRGNAPIPWALINGLTKTGVTFFILGDTPDSGPIVAQKEVQITMDDDAYSLYKKITGVSSMLLAEIVEKMEQNKLIYTKQDEKKSSVWPKRKPEDSIIDWNSMSIYLYNWIRGLTHPYPGAFTFIGDKKLFVWKAEMYNANFNKKKQPGEILDISKSGMLVKTGDGVILLKRVQIEGSKEVEAKELVCTQKLKSGFILG